MPQPTFEVIGRFYRSAKEPVLITHEDADGVLSGSIANWQIAAYHRRAAKKTFLLEEPNIDDRLLRTLVSYEPRHIIITDLAVDRQPALLQLKEGADILLIDHHGDRLLPPVDMNDFGILHFHSYLRCKQGGIRPENYTASKLCYDIARYLKPGDCLSQNWKAAAGLIGDGANRDGR